MNNRRLFSLLFILFIPFVLFPQGRLIRVNSSSQLEDAVKNLTPGDTVEVVDGSYDFGGNISITRSGSDQNKITIRAENTGGVRITGGSYFDLKRAAHIVIQGFVFETRNETAVKTIGCNNIRITRNIFRLKETESLKWIVIGGVWNDPNAESHHNRIDHNLFEGKTFAGNCITIDGSGEPTYQSSRYDRIDHNHFRNIGPRIENGMETIRIGWSEMSMSSGFTTVEYNLFENCDGDPEIISVKTCDDTIRFNTFRSSKGTLSLRHGNRSSVYGNFFFGEGKDGTGGIRLYGDDHKIYNNYFEGLTGTKWDAPLTITNGDYDGGSNYTKHFRINNALIVHNTLVNNQHGIEVGYTNNGNYKKPPRNVIIANNLIVSNQNEIVKIISEPENFTWNSNIFFTEESAEVGFDFTDEQNSEIDPELILSDSLWRLQESSPAINSSSQKFDFVLTDIDLQDRDNFPDIGADEFSAEKIINKPLSANDVGPFAFEDKITTVSSDETSELNFILNQNYPNPFNPETTISFTLPYQSRIELKVYDIRGSLVAELIDANFAKGQHTVKFSGNQAARHLSSGIYFYRLTGRSIEDAGNFSQTRKMILLK